MVSLNNFTAQLGGDLSISRGGRRRLRERREKTSTKSRGALITLLTLHLWGSPRAPGWLWCLLRTLTRGSPGRPRGNRRLGPLPLGWCQLSLCWLLLG